MQYNTNFKKQLLFQVETGTVTVFRCKNGTNRIYDAVGSMLVHTPASTKEYRKVLSITKEIIDIET